MRPIPTPGESMALSPWLALRQAKEAVRAGRPDDAHALLGPLLADGHRKAVRLLPDVARAFASRGERHLRADDPDAAWKELLAAEGLNTGDPRTTELRQSLTRVGLAECRAALEAGRPLHAIEATAKLRDRRARSPELAAVEDAAQDWVLAAEMADRGDFLLAVSTLDRARSRLGSVPPTGLERFAAELAARHERFRSAVARMADAADARQWRDAARAADEVIAAAPTHREARQAQMRAWEAVQPATASYHGPADPAAVPLLAVAGSAFANTRPHPSNGSTPGQVDLHHPSPAPGRTPTLAGGLPKRFLLWVDGVGGYLVCLSPRVTFGQATADGPIDVPLFADLSRLHAEVSRDGEGYVLESGRGARVNGTPAAKTLLKCGDRVTLGQTCQFVFRQPVPVSPSARLELVSGHRLPLAVDGVLLMADNLILGPGPQAHVVLPWAAGSVILYRSKDGLGVRFGGPFTVDNRPCRERASLSLPAAVATDAFAFAVEPVGARL